MLAEAYTWGGRSAPRVRRRLVCYNERSTALLQPSLCTLGGDTASTGVKTRGMHAEPHGLVNPVEHNVTADSQLALAA